MNIDNAFPSNYLKASELPDEGITVTIQSVEMEVIGKDEKPVLYFKEENLTGGKSLVLNKTNAGTITEVLKTPETDKWIGRRIVIFPTETDYQGKRVACIRVKLRVPQAAPRTTPAAARAQAQRRTEEPPPESPSNYNDSDVPF